MCLKRNPLAVLLGFSIEKKEIKIFCDGKDVKGETITLPSQKKLVLISIVLQMTIFVYSQGILSGT